MSRRRVTASAADQEKEAMLASSYLVARLMPAADPADYQHPAIAEALATHKDAKAYVRSLQGRGLSWEDTLAALSERLDRRPQPIRDMLRAQAEAPPARIVENGLE